jgi:hypothetical protein
MLFLPLVIQKHVGEPETKWSGQLHDSRETRDARPPLLQHTRDPETRDQNASIHETPGTQRHHHIMHERTILAPLDQ